MLTILLNKVLFVLFFLAILNAVRHTYYFIQAWFASTEEQPVKYKLSMKALLILGISIAYILTTVSTGIKL